MPEEAVICDLDGTLADIGSRDPYNPTTVLDDRLNTHIAELIGIIMSSGIQIIFITGRFEKLRGQTIEWLEKHGMKDYLLYMRKDNDFRKDIIYKKEIYKRLVAGKYRVICVLEDRDQTVAMWRREGLTCLQVAYGNF